MVVSAVPHALARPGAVLQCGSLSTFHAEPPVTKTVTTLSSREFNQDTSRARKAARKGPVFITHRGRTTHVLMTIDDYHALTGEPMILAEALAQPEGADLEGGGARRRLPIGNPAVRKNYKIAA